MDWAPSTERFVEIPGIVEIRWVSDDPDYYQEPIDLFDEQKNGLPDYYGKKDKQTTEQAWFTCNVCECDLKSVVTLRAHCKGSQHVRKALQKKMEYRKKNGLKKEASDGGASTSRVNSQKFKTLFEYLEATSEAVVGLKFITEYLSSRTEDPPMYHCSICDDIQGDAETMKNHILSLKHRQSFLEREMGSFLVHQVEVQQAVAEFTKDYRRDYREMQEVKDDKVWREISRGTFRPRRERQRSRSPKRERRDYRDDYWRDYREDERRVKRERSRSPRRTKQERRDYYEHDDREGRGSRYDDRERRGDRDDRHRDSYSSRRDDHYQDRDRSRHEDSRSSVSHRDNGSDVSREKSRSQESHSSRPRVKNEYRDEDDISEVSRSGNFENWSTARIKTSREDQDCGSNGYQGQQVVGETERVSTTEDDVARLHRRVAKHVMDKMNKYYPDTEEFDPMLHKIRDGVDYSRTAKALSHELRAKIKDSYEAYNGTLEGISLTGDNVAFIESEVERHFELIPVIRSGSNRW